MAKYQVTAIGLDNKKLTETIDARDEDDFRKIMRSRSLVPVKFKVLEEKGTNYRMKPDETAEFCRQLASMLSSGITAVRAMDILKQRDFKPKLKAVYEKLHKDVLQGLSIAEAMRLQGKVFPELLINMMASGEASGQLENTTDKMATHYEKEHRLNGKIKSAMRYPKILAVATVGVVFIIFIFVLPSFFDMLEGMEGVELPLITVIIVGISNFLISWWYIILIAALIIVAGVQYLLSIHKVKLSYDKLLLHMPVIGKLLKVIYTARFSRTLSSLYSSGVSMISALEIVGTIVGNKYVESQFPEFVRDVRNGDPLSDSIRKVDGFDNKLPNTILIGEEAGRLDSMLASTADAFDYEAEMATGALVALAEPVMIVVMAVVIMVVILAVMLPMMSLYSGFSG